MKKQKGFTLIEIMVVIAIIAGLVAMVAPNIIGEAGSARVKTAKAEISTISSALDMYKLDNYSYPKNDEGIEALVKKPASAKNWRKGGYLKKTPTDPWGNAYLYYAEDGGFEIISLGADGEEGGEDDAADISSNEL